MSLRNLRWIDDDAAPFPPTSQALGADSEAPGLLAAGGRLSVRRLEQAYRHGIFPWYSDGQPVLWWAPDPRMVLPVAEFKLHALAAQDAGAASFATPGCEVRIDSDFERVIARLRRHRARASAAPGSCRRWSTPTAAWHRARRGAQRRDLDRRRAGRRPVRRGHRPHVLRRIDVLACAPTRRRSRSPRWWPFAARTASTLIDCQQHTGHLASLGRARDPARRVRAPPGPGPGRTPPSRLDL